MHEQADGLARRFEEHRARLTAIAERMLGSAAEADDAVQEVWIRLARSDAEAIENLGGWLTTVVSRVCLNLLQARRARPELPLEDEPAGGAGPGVSAGPEEEAVLADTIGLALLVVLDRLSPAERIAFVLHDLFGVRFADIAPIVDRSPAAARQLASRARRRVRGTGPDEGEDGGESRATVAHAALVDAFLAAARDGDFGRLLALLAPDVVMRADPASVLLGAEPETHGAEAVAAFCRRARGAAGALVDGVPVAVWMPGGRPRVVFDLTAREGRITAIELIGDPDRLAQADLVVLHR